MAVKAGNHLSPSTSGYGILHILPGRLMTHAARQTAIGDVFSERVTGMALETIRRICSGRAVLGGMGSRTVAHSAIPLHNIRCPTTACLRLMAGLTAVDPTGRAVRRICWIRDYGIHQDMMAHVDCDRLTKAIMAVAAVCF